MPAAVTMPKLGLTMEEGTVEQWLKREGDAVRAEEPLLIVAMDKASVEVPAPADGVLDRIVVSEGGTVPVGGVIAYLRGANEAPSTSLPAAAAGAGAGSAAAAAAGSGGGGSTGGAGAGAGGLAVAAPAAAGTNGARRPYFASPRARMRARELGLDLARLTGTGPGGRIIEADVLEAAQAAPAAPPAAAAALPARGAPVGVSPAVRQLAASLGVDLARVSGSGPGGRVLERDVRAAAGAGAAPGSAPAPARPAAGLLALTRVRRLTAERMAQSARTVARVTLFREVDMGECVRLRAQLAEEFQARGTRLSYDLLIAKASALALREHPAVNARWVDGQGIEILESVNVGVAVALEPEGLIVPVLRDADRRNLLDLARELDGLVERARTGRLGPDELTGGSFTITNLGAYGVDRFTPIVNPPETAILGVGRLAERPAVVAGQLAVAQRLELALSFDHRVVDGAPAARFLQRIAEALERPYRLLAEWS